MVQYIKPRAVTSWWPNALNLFCIKMTQIKPFRQDFNYEELKKLDIDALKDICMTDSQEWWP
jgi:catalase (peroxidase I)